MSVNKEIKNIILLVVADGEVHTVEEFKEAVTSKNIELGKKNQAISNALYQLKKENESFLSVGIGRYKLVCKERENEEKNVVEEAINIIFKELDYMRKIDWKTDDISLIIRGKENVERLRELKERLNQEL